MMKRLTVIGFAVMTFLIPTQGRSDVDGLSARTVQELSWGSELDRFYQLQVRNGDGGAVGGWINIGEEREGTGEVMLQSHTPTGVHSLGDYRVVEVIPGDVVVPDVPANGTFEVGDGGEADGWALGGSQPPVRSDQDSHRGTYSIHSVIENEGASPGEALLTSSGVSTGLVGGGLYRFSFWVRQVRSASSYLRQHRVQWLDGEGSVVGSTGLKNFSGGSGDWTEVSLPDQTAPISAVGAKFTFRFVTGAVNGGLGEVFIDDVSLLPAGDDGSRGPGMTNYLPVEVAPVLAVSWPTIPGAEYRPSVSTNLLSDTWERLGESIWGDGGIQTLKLPITQEREFVRVESPDAVLHPPSGLRVVSSGLTNAIGLAWSASPTSGVLGYRVLYGVAVEELTEELDVGDVTTATLTGLVLGQAYYFAVVAYTAEEATDPLDAVVSATPDATPQIAPLFGENTVLESATTFETEEALVTRVGDRGRGRHAREDGIRGVRAGPLYDVYLSFYWEGRTVAIEFIDRVAKGGDDIIVNIESSSRLGTKDFRAFFRGMNTVAEYHHNAGAQEIGPNLYTTTIRYNPKERRGIEIGDLMEIEFSPFLAAPENGRANYYGTAILYVVGQGIVPWEAEGSLLDSVPLPEMAWLGGKTTQHQQYSNEPEHLFKQMAGNLSPTNAQPFMLGRRLHHTDFGDGAHSEGGNSVFEIQAGKLGAKFINRSCVACHVNNGRAQPSNVGESMNLAVVKVGSDPSGNLPDPVLGAVLQPQSIGSEPEGDIVLSGYTELAGQYGDGTQFSLRKPNYSFQDVAPSHFSVRVAPQLVGMGLLEAISEADVLSLADPGDADGDGVSGRAQRVIDPETGQLRLGRFGYKGGKARLRHQVAGALNTDMGVATSVFP